MRTFFRGNHGNQTKSGSPDLHCDTDFAATAFVRVRDRFSKPSLDTWVHYHDRIVSFPYELRRRTYSPYERERNLQKGRNPSLAGQKARK